MKQSDGNITHADIQQLRQQAMKQGWGQVAVEILGHEPILEAAVSNRWAKIRIMLEASGLTEEQSMPVLIQISRLLVESIGVVQRSSRRLWDDMLPGDEEGRDSK